MTTGKTPRKWTRLGKVYLCQPWTIIQQYVDGTSLWALMRFGEGAPVGYFEDLDAAMAEAKRIETTEQMA